MGDEPVWTVLIVDDEADVRSLIALTLGFDDHLRVVGSAANAGEALALAGETHPHLVVLDQLLGGPVTGLQVADQLRAAHPGTRVILFSAADKVIDLREHRVDAVVSKMDIGELPDIARRVLANSP
jgi:DNA-binding NarL/FixJ family response regulator